MAQEHSNRISRRAFGIQAGAIAAVGSGAIASFTLTGCVALKPVKPEDWRVVEGWPRRPSNIEWEVMSEVSIDPGGRVVVLNRKHPHVQIYSPDGELLKVWKEPKLDAVHGLGIAPDGHVWVSELGQHVVRKYTPDGKRVMTLGTPGKPGCDEKHFYLPTDIAVNAAGDVFVSDGYGNARVVRFDKNGKYITEWGGYGEGDTQLITPHMLALDSKGRVYVADRDSGRIKVFDANGKSLAVWASMTPWNICITGDDKIWVCGSSRFPNPKWKGVEPENLSKKAPKRGKDGGPVIVAPPKDQIVVLMNTKGEVLGSWTLPMITKGKKKRPGEVDWIHGIAVDKTAALYLADIQGQRVQKFVRKTG